MERMPQREFPYQKVLNVTCITVLDHLVKVIFASNLYGKAFIFFISNYKHVRFCKTISTFLFVITKILRKILPLFKYYISDSNPTDQFYYHLIDIAYNYYF